MAIQYSRIGHQVANIAYQHQRAPFERHLSPVSCGKPQVGIQFSSVGLATFYDFFGQITAHQAQPVAIGQDLVTCIHRGNTVFAIHDCRYRCLQPDVCNACQISGSDRAVGINLDNKMQAVIAQKNAGRGRAIAPKPDKLRRVRKTSTVNQKYAILHTQ